MHKIAVLAIESFVTLDLAIPCEVFNLAVSSGGENLYDVQLCCDKAETKNNLFTLTKVQDLSYLLEVDTIIVPGIMNFDKITDKIINHLQKAANKGVRIVSICSGAFVLAAAGLLNGLQATTHWELTKKLAKEYEAVTVKYNTLFIDNEKIMTSAGLTSGIDLCLHIVRKDFGATISNKVAQMLVMPIERGGSQVQIIKYETPLSSDNLNDLLLWITENLHREYTVAELADKSNMSVRSLNRKFNEQTGTTPLKWILHTKIQHAQLLLETTSLSIENIATATGFNSAITFRGRFKKIVGVSPSAWRNTYKQKNP